MQETVTNSSERKSLFSSFFEIHEAREKHALAERQLQEEKYLRRTQKIYDYHERQRRDVVELRRCLDYVSQHAHVLESVLRGAGSGAGSGAGGGAGGDGTPVPLSAALVRQAAALQRCMAQCVANAVRIRHLFTATHQPQMDNMLAKMEAEKSAWTSFVQRAVDATRTTELVIDNLHNMIDVLLRTDSVGICGSDVHYWHSGSCGNFVLKEPMIMGHEASGVVAKLGSKVKSLAVGDRVAIEPGVPCRYCEFCKTGRYHLCPDIICATPPCHGNLMRYYKHAADFCYKLPEHVSMEEGALLEPLAVAVHACRRGGVGAGHAVLVLGAGTIGLLTMLTARVMGATKILITDVLESRLEFAKKLGADATLLVSRDADEPQLVRRVHELLGVHPDVAFDASGANATVRLCLLATKSGGVAVLVVMGSPEQTVPLAAALSREVDVRGIFRYVNEYPIALNMVASGDIL